MPKLIHVVDDDSSFRTAIQRRLLKAGYEVEIYASAQDLLDRRPDERRTSCILLDIRIPDLSGPELQQRLKDLGSTLPIVFLSGHADLQTTVQTIKAGADDVLSKPVDSERLLKAIEDAITRHEGLRKQQATLDAY
jgi:FixJ family two-component response regulator